MIEFIIEEQDQHKIIKLTGEIDLYCVGDLKKDLLKVIESDDEFNSVVMDMKDLQYMDSSGIALMANLQKKSKAKKRKFSLISVNEDIMNVLRLSALDSFFQIFNDLNSIA